MMINPSLAKAKNVPLNAAKRSCIVGSAVGLVRWLLPGDRMLLTLGFTTLLGLELLASSGTARVVNLSSNLAALAVFLINGSVDFSVGIPCAIASIAGGWIGSRLALRIGRRVIKPIMLLVLALLLIKVALDVL